MQHTRKNILTIFIIGSLFFKCNAQINRDFQSPRDRWFFGGNLGLSFGTITDIEISPQVGYYITKKWATGVGLHYEYYKRSDYLKIETHIYGGNLFTRYFLIPDMSVYFPVKNQISLFTQLEFSGLSLEDQYFNSASGATSTKGRFLSENYFIGGGIYSPFTERSGLYFMVLYLINESRNSPYQNPVIRLGFNF